jgi:hypothetical protein
LSDRVISSCMLERYRIAAWWDDVNVEPRTEAKTSGALSIGHLRWPYEVGSITLKLCGHRDILNLVFGTKSKKPSRTGGGRRRYS